MSALYPDAVGIDQIRAYSKGLASLVDTDSLRLPVPTCGDWTMADLVWHLTWVQDFWVPIIANRPAGPESYDRPDRPPDGELGEGLHTVAHNLTAALDNSEPTDTAWSWSTEQTVAFTLRRQTHEALVHYVDGLLATGRPLPHAEPRLGADGVAEMVEIMLGGVPNRPDFDRTSGVIELRTTDTDDAWTLAFGRPTGTTTPAVELAPGATSDATVTADALDLDLWLWGRQPDTAVSIDGSADVASGLRKLIAESSQ